MTSASIDSTPATAAIMLASWRRLGLAVLIDLALFGAFWSLVRHFAPPLPQLPVLRWMVFVVAELFLFRRHWSPGEILLGIRAVSVARDDAPTGERLRQVRVVDPDIRRHETKVTMLLGYLFVLDGTKAAARWTQFGVPEPFFGAFPDRPTHVVVSLATGLLWIVIGVRIFGLRRDAPWLALGGLALLLASIVASWNLWEGWARDYVASRDAWQARAPDPRRGDWMAAIVPEWPIAWVAFQMVLLLLSLRRFRR